jgi:hypothetical protein
MILEYQKHSTGWEISWMMNCGKTTAKKGRHLEGFLTAAVHKRMQRLRQDRDISK